MTYVLTRLAGKLLRMIAGNGPVIDALQPALDAYIRRGVSKKTVRNDIDRLGPFCQHLANKRLAEVTAGDVDEWVEKLAVRLAFASVESHKQSLKAFFNWCVARDDVALGRSPAEHLHVRRRRSARNKAANEADVLQVIEGLTDQVVEGEPKVIRDLLAFRLAYDSGNRLSELATLSTRDVAIALRRPLLSSNGIVVYVAQSQGGKTGAVSIRFTEYTASVYHLWQEVRPRVSSHRTFIALGGNQPGRPLTLDGFTGIFVTRCRQFGVAVYRTHSFRHLKGTKVTDLFGPRVAASMLNITVETAMMHYYDEDERATVDATGV